MKDEIWVSDDDWWGYPDNVSGGGRRYIPAEQAEAEIARLRAALLEAFSWVPYLNDPKPIVAIEAIVRKALNNE